MIASVMNNRTSRMLKVNATRPSHRLRRWVLSERASSASWSCADDESWDSGLARSVGVVR